MKIKIAMALAGLALLAGCNSHPAPKHTPSTVTAQPVFSGPSPTCRPSNYANVPGTREYNKKPCSK